MKLNRKGFTLIELLAVVIILGLVLIIVFPNSIDVFKNAKLKSEEAFLDRLSQSIDSYIELNTDSIIFSEITGKYSKEQNGSSYQVTLKEGKKIEKGITKSITINDVIGDNIITSSDYINPSNKEVSCNPKNVLTNEDEPTQIEVYKDSDFVYCHKVKASEMPCLTDDYKNKLKEEQGTDDPYAIDTCIWTEE